MIRLSLFTFVLLIGLSIGIAKNDMKFRNIYQKRSSRNNEQLRILRNLMGKLIDTETNIIYAVDGEKQQNMPLNSDATTTIAVAPPSPFNAPPIHEEIACLAACHSCVEEFSVETRKKKAADNCGPMCDCADSCFLMSIEQVGQIYGQSSNTRADKDCWSRTYSEMLTNGLSSSA